MRLIAASRRPGTVSWVYASPAADRRALWWQVSLTTHSPLGPAYAFRPGASGSVSSGEVPAKWVAGAVVPRRGLRPLRPGACLPSRPECPKRRPRKAVRLGGMQFAGVVAEERHGQSP